MIITDDEVVSIYNYSMKIIEKIARKLAYNDDQIDDICSIGKVALMEMIHAYSDKSENEIKKYIEKNIESEIKNKLKKTIRQYRFERSCRSLDSRRMAEKINKGII